MQWLKHFFGLFYPDICLACNIRKPTIHNKLLCVICELNLPFTDYHTDPQNSMHERFWGRVNIQQAASYLHYTKGGNVQNLIHSLKYLKKKQVGLQLGEIYGKILSQTDSYQSIDAIIPVPLHPKKERKRGFNQSEVFGKGLSVGMGKPLITNILTRSLNTDTQTKKSRMERFSNVNEAFLVNLSLGIKDTHFLLVDDVMTTGATLESCAQELLKIPNAKVSVVTIACAVF